MVEFDAVVVGAGFGGLYALYALRNLGLKVVLIERADGVGGTWYWNRYPGARCDIPVHEYSYSFSKELQQEWFWSEKYASQEELLKYLNHVAERFDLLKDIRFNEEVVKTVWEEVGQRWKVYTASGLCYSGRFVIMALGNLSIPIIPKVPGMENFQGPIFHSAEWPRTPIEIKDKNIVLVGTGASAVQILPVVAKEAKKVYVLQRTANFCVPMKNHKITPEEDAEIKRNYDKLRADTLKAATGILNPVPPPYKPALDDSEEQRRARYELAWEHYGFQFLTAYRDLLINRKANDTATDFMKSKIRDVVKDQENARLLTSMDYPVGSKRFCLESGYFEAFNRDNVELIDIKTKKWERVTKTGVEVNGRHIEADVIILATGFDAVSGALARLEITGRNGLTLQEAWKDGAKSYMALCFAGFPNFFTVTGPFSPAAFANIVFMIERDVDWIKNLVKWTIDHRISSVEISKEAEEGWVNECARTGAKAVYSETNSFFTGGASGKPKRLMAYIKGSITYHKLCRQEAERGYPNFFKVAKSSL